LCISYFLLGFDTTTYDTLLPGLNPRKSDNCRHFIISYIFPSHTLWLYTLLTFLTSILSSVTIISTTLIQTYWQGRKLKGMWKEAKLLFQIHRTILIRSSENSFFNNHARLRLLIDPLSFSLNSLHLRYFPGLFS